MQLQDGNNREGTLVVLRVDPSPVADGMYFVSNPQYQNDAATADGTPINANWSNSNPNHDQQWIFKSYGNGIHTIINGNGTYASFSQTNQTTLDGTLQANSQPCYWKVSRGTGAGY
ncbi:hypothetical protein Hypma_005399 [Hypsizygus marmoreus]|uniref:Uncharacterized protein n=1 Tax=Hypsizygus marmoreus TaxID=39966 RepID=A0A369K284_HYPMA|nr:hypothetical protein Hypma_005399 [Hypsizygus marmoreus]